jgi:hypothetical protein
MSPRIIQRVGFILALSLCLGACGKEKHECPSPSTSPVDGRNQFVGQYKVYNTSGTFLYHMEILKATDLGRDSLFVVNWGNKFNLYIRHEDGDQTNYLNYNPPFPSIDHQGHRWAFVQDLDPAFQSNLLLNDTLRMSYRISNIAFYAQDGVPFFDSTYREYGVKQ